MPDGCRASFRFALRNAVQPFALKSLDCTWRDFAQRLAVNATNETNDRDAQKETMVEGVLSHEVVGHARDITKDQKTWKDQNTQDASMAYQTRRNEVSADRASKRVAVERLIGGYVHFKDFRRDLRFGRKMTP